MLKAFLLALSTLTILPIPYSSYDGAEGKNAAYYFPVVGVLVGVLISSLAAVSLKFFSVEYSALFVLFISVYISRSFHLDGFADCADAFWSSRPTEKKIEIMKDSRIGVMGVVALIFLLVAKFIFIREIMSRQNVLLYLFLFPFVGRCSMNFHMLLIKPKEQGLGSFFWNAKTAFSSLIIISALMFYFMTWQKSLTVLVMLLLTAFLWSFYVKKNVENGSGDSLGASCEWGELILLFSVAELFPYVS